MNEQFRHQEFEYEHLREVAAKLNDHFKNGGSALDVLTDIRTFPFPIVVDFNNVLVNNRVPYDQNPRAKDFLSALSGIGNIFIITSGDNWNEVLETMERFDLWDDRMVLMVARNYKFIGQSTEGQKLRDEYITMAREKGIDCSRKFLRAPSAKAVAPIFFKPFLVPIIDDYPMATEWNNGMLGITVEAWDNERIYSRGKGLKSSLSEAVEIVEGYYDSLQIEGIV